MDQARHGMMVVIVVTLGLPSFGVAQTGTDDAESATKAAQREHRAAVRAFAQGDYPTAIAGFKEADRLRPNPAFSFNIAKAYDAQGDASRALASYREYLRRAEQPADAEDVHSRITALAGHLKRKGVQQISVRSTPPGAAVFLDSEPVGVSPVTLDIAPGKHSLGLRLGSYQSVRTVFELAPEEPLDVAFALVPAQDGAAPGREAVLALPPAEEQRVATRPSAKEVPARSRVLRTIGFAALGASVAAIGGAVTFEIMRSNAESDANREREQLKAAERLDTMHTRQTVARVLAGTGGALAALGGVMLIADSLSGKGDERRPPRNLGLVCAPSKCVATYSARF